MWLGAKVSILMDDSELARCELVMEQHGVRALRDRLALTSNELSEFLVYRASGGGTIWPTELVQLGANPNFCDDEGNTALSRCVHARYDSRSSRTDTFLTAIELLSLGADPNQRYSTFCSVTSLAASSGQADFVALFLLAGADLTLAEGDFGGSLSEYLSTSERPWVRQLLQLINAATRPVASRR